VQVAAAFEQLEEPDWLLVDAAQPQQAVAPTFFSRPIGGGSGQSGLREAAAAQHLTGGYQRVPEDHLGVFRPWCWPHDRIYPCVLEAGVSRSPSTGLMQARSPTQR
jgi:hypothetical protein